MASGALFLIIVIVLIGSLANAPLRQEMPAGARAGNQEKVWPVRVADPMISDVWLKRTLFGRVIAPREHDLSFQTAGCIEERDQRIKVGGIVGQGMLIAELTTEALEIDLSSAEATLAALVAERDAIDVRKRSVRELSVLARQSHRVETRDLERKKSLSSEAITLSLLDESLQSVLQTQSQIVELENELQELDADMAAQAERINSARRDVAARRLQIEQASLRSPVDGVVKEVLQGEGACVGAAEPIVTLLDTSYLEIRLDVLPASFHGAGLTGRVVDVATVDADVPMTTEAAITRQAPDPAPETGLTTVFARFDQESFRPLPGQVLQAELNVKMLNGVLTLPASGVYDGDTIFSVGDDDRLNPHQVEIVDRDGGQVFLRTTDDLADPVVVTRIDTIMPGTKVHVLPGQK